MTKKYDSKFEQQIDKQFPQLEYHPENTIQYTIPSRYEPDFKYCTDNKTYLIESKGRFRTSTEAAKYKHVREVLPANHEIVFVFMKPNTPMPNAKKRRDGTKQTQEEWATKNGFRFFYTQNLKELINTP
ncbi:hypothetical protein [Pantoea agglomerans]|uniref:hypothetical protein n=1 Tax=Enterobacter agglomerans TaxID=549 RepID=UPI003BA2681D